MRPALYYQPLGLIADIENTVVIKNFGKLAGRKITEPVRIGRPDSGSHGDNEMIFEQTAVFIALQVVIKGDKIILVVKQTG